MQVDILHLLRMFFERKNVEQMLPMLPMLPEEVWIQAARVLLRTFEHISLHGGSKNIIGHAIDLECTFASASLICLKDDSNNIKTNLVDDTPLSPEMLLNSLAQKSLKHMVRFIQCKNFNMKYAGLSGIERLFEKPEVEYTTGSDANSTISKDINKDLEDLQNGVMSCLESSDPSIRQKALSLLPLMATASNVRSICDKIIGQIRLQQSSKTESVIGKEDLISKVLGMAEKFYLRSYDKTNVNEELIVTFDWYVFVLVRLLQAAHGAQRESILLKIKRNLTPSKNKHTATTSTSNKQENEIDDGGDLEIIKVGTKLTGILRKLVFSNLEKAVNADMDKVI